MFEIPSKNEETNWIETKTWILLLIHKPWYLCSDGRKSERDCGDQATKFGRGEPKNTWGSKRKVFLFMVVVELDLCTTD